MTRSAMAALLGPEFDAFLFAPVDEQGQGGLLSVLSALARLDIDPWQEAADLAGMPRGAARRRLASLLAALPDAPAAPEAIERLVALLPRRDRTSIASRANLLRADPAPTSHTVANMILINLLVMAGMLCAQWALTSLQPAHVGTTYPAASGTIVPHSSLYPVPAPRAIGE